MPTLSARESSVAGEVGMRRESRLEFINILDETVDVMHAKWVLEEMR